MKRLLLILLYISYYTHITAQVVDKTRLEYDEDQLSALQVGMAVTKDQKQAAFLLDNGELRIFDFYNSVFTHSYQVDLLEVFEIAFTQDDQSLLIVESNRIRLLNWKSGEIILTKNYQERVQNVRVARFDNHFGVAFQNHVEIWNKDQMEVVQTLKIKQNIMIIDFSYTEPHIIVSPKWSLIRNQMYVFDYQTGKELEYYKKKYFGLYDKSGKTYFYQNNAVPGLGPGVPVYGHRTLPSGNDYQPILIMAGDQVKASDVGALMTCLRIDNKVIGSVGYRGFSVFDYYKGGMIFTTRKTKRERSSSSLSFYGDYQANPLYLIAEDKALINAYGDNINQIYSATQNEIIGYIFVDANGEYAVVSRDGRFDGTSESSEKLYWTARKSL